MPALLTEGLLRHARMIYALPPGYYPPEAIFLYLAPLAPVRCRSLEQTSALAGEVRETLARSDDARALLRDFF